MLNDPQKTVSQTETIKDSLSGSRVPVTLDILLEMRFPDDVTISSDGKKVAFVVWENVPDEPKRRGRIWVADTPAVKRSPLARGNVGKPVLAGHLMANNWPSSRRPKETKKSHNCT